MRRSLFLFAKEPVPGRVKTRLCPPLRPEAAARVYAAILETLVDRFADPGSFAGERVLAHDGSRPSPYFMELVEGRGYRLEAQEGKDLLERMEACFNRAFSRGADFAFIVGTDVPALSPVILSQAVERSREADVVLGPDRSGGCYLIGRRAGTPPLFEAVRESSDRFLDDLLSTCERRALRCSRLVALDDIDTSADLARFRRRRRAFPDRVLYVRRIAREDP